MLSSLAVASLSFTGGINDLARPSQTSAQLSSEPPIWLTHNFLTQETAKHMLTKVPTDEAAYSPCIGQVDEFKSKRCTFLPVQGDSVVEDFIAQLERTWNIDTSLLMRGLPVIRYLPGAPPVGKHGDEDRHGVVPNATLVVYLTNTDVTSTGQSGQTIFPEAGVTVAPRQGSVLSFQNVDAAGAPHPKAKHLVGAVPAEAAGDRLVLQIPIAHKAGVRPYAYPEHVSGNKKPGQHEYLHGNDAQKAAAQAAIAAGFGIAVAYMAAKAGKFEEGDVDGLVAAAKETGKFDDADFEKKAQ